MKTKFNQNQPKILRAAILEKTGEPLTICDVEIPPLKAEQVLVKVLYSGVCRSQLMEIDGQRGPDNWLPHMLGHEGTGVILKVGRKVKKVTMGDQVILTWIKSNGLEPKGGQQYFSKDNIINAGHITTLSNYTVVSENRVVKKPSNMNPKLAALFGCALPTGSGMVLNQLKPKIGSSVGVLGLGGVGLSAIAALNHFSCKKICAIDLSEKKLKLAQDLGATDLLNPQKQNIKDTIFEITEGKGLDCCIESAGYTKTIELAFSLLKKNSGKLIFASHPGRGEKIELDPHELISGKKIEGSWGGNTNPDIDIPRLYEFLTQKDISIDKLVTKIYSLEQINQACDDLRTGKVFRPIIEMAH